MDDPTSASTHKRQRDVDQESNCSPPQALQGVEELTAVPDAKKQASGWRALGMFAQTLTTQLKGGVQMIPEEAVVVPDQGRDIEKSPPPSNYPAPPSCSSSPEREDPPSPNNASFFHAFMANATDAWIQSQTSTNSTSIHEDGSVSVHTDTDTSASLRRYRKKRALKSRRRRQISRPHFESDPHVTGNEATEESPTQANKEKAPSMEAGRNYVEFLSPLVDQSESDSNKAMQPDVMDDESIDSMKDHFDKETTNGPVEGIVSDLKIPMIEHTLSEDSNETIDSTAGSVDMPAKSPAASTHQNETGMPLQSAATIIQAYVRRHETMKARKTMDGASRVIQRSLRHWRDCTELRVRLQALAQRARARKARAKQIIASTTLIQAYTRRWITQQDYQRKQDALHTIQNSMRQWRDRTKLQAAMSSLLRQARGKRKYEEVAAITIQAYVRRDHARRMFAKKMQAQLDSKSPSQLLAGSAVVTAEKVQYNGIMQLGASLTNAFHKITVAKDSDRVTSDYEQTYRDLRAEIAMLRSENNKLRTDLDSSREDQKLLEARLIDSDSRVEMYQSRIKGLVRANDSLVEALQVASQTSPQKPKEIQEYESKLKTAEEELRKAKEMHRLEIQKLEKVIGSSETQNQEIKRRWEEEIVARRERRVDQKKKKDDETNDPEQQVQLTGLIGVLENSQTNHQDEISRLTTELLAVKKEKDKTILKLEQEVKALQVRKEDGPEAISRAIQPRILQRQLDNELVAHSQRVEEFDSIRASLNALIAETCVLPRYVSEREMKRVIEQQERGEKMNQLIDTLAYLFQEEGESQRSRSQKAFALVEEYISRTEPNRMLSELRNRLEKLSLQTSCYQEELREKSYCKRCAIRDSAAQKRR